jgi:serine/threonine protein phosphatase 1
MRHFLMGDVHGMSVELKSLVETLGPREEDTFVFVGDLVDKGPESPEVVRFVRELSERHNVVLVEGNHEEKHRRFRKHVAAENGVADTMKGAEEMRSITEALSAEDVAFLDTAVLFHRVDEHGVLVVHAGVTGDMAEFPSSVEEAAAMSNKKRKSLSKILRCRFLNAETGKFLSLGDNTEGDPFWAEVYDGRFGHVVFGHEPFMDGPRSFDHATGVDTGAVFGGRLTALVLNTESPERTFVSVPSRGKFCKQFGE